MPISAEAPAQTSSPALLPRHEAFARHVSAGRGPTEAARMAGYPWDVARRTGARLMEDARIAARVADLARAAEQQRRGELEELIGILEATRQSAQGQRMKDLGPIHRTGRPV